MSSIFGRKLGSVAANFGRKILGGGSFAQKVNNFASKVNSGISKFDAGAQKAQNVLEKISASDPTGIAKTASTGLGLARTGAHIVGDATRVGSSLATGNLQGALNQGKAVVSDAKHFMGSAGTFGAQAATTAAGALAFL